MNKTSVEDLERMEHARLMNRITFLEGNKVLLEKELAVLKDEWYSPEHMQTVQERTIDPLKAELAATNARIKDLEDVLYRVNILFDLWDGGLDAMDGDEYTQACIEWDVMNALVKETMPLPASPEDEK